MPGEPFSYNPGVTNRSGELLAAGISQAGQNIGAAIAEAKRKHDELKSYSALYQALSQDPTSGLDPNNPPKNLAELKMAPIIAEISRGRKAAQQKQAALGALGRLAGNIRQYMQPTPGAVTAPGGPLDTTTPMTEGVTQAPPTPGLSALDAILKARGESPAIYQDPDAAKEADALQEMILKGQQTGVTIDPGTGLPVFHSGTSARVVNPAWLTGGKANTALDRLTGPTPPPDITVPEDKEWVRGPTGWEMQAKAKKAAYTDPEKPPTAKAPNGYDWVYNGYFWEQKAQPQNLEDFVTKFSGGGQPAAGTPPNNPDPLGLFPQ
jgi:hypothetical protein